MITIPQSDVLHSAAPFPGNDILRLISYPNRNSVPYKKIYGLRDSKTVIRGTIRYQGFCEILAGFNDLGLLKDDVVPSSVVSWPQLIQSLIQSQKCVSSSPHCSRLQKTLFEEFELSKVSSNVNFKTLIHALTSHKIYSGLSFEATMDKLRKIFNGMFFLNMFNPESKIVSKKSRIEILCDAMKEKLSADKCDRDLVIMVHYLKVEYTNRPTGILF